MDLTRGVADDDNDVAKGESVMVLVRSESGFLLDDLLSPSIISHFNSRRSEHF